MIVLVLTAVSLAFASVSMSVRKHRSLRRFRCSFRVPAHGPELNALVENVFGAKSSVELKRLVSVQEASAVLVVIEYIATAKGQRGIDRSLRLENNLSGISFEGRFVHPRSGRAERAERKRIASKAA